MKLPERDNRTIFFWNEFFYTFGANFMTESYVQAYLLLLGLTDGQISLYGTFSYAAAFLSYAAFILYKPANDSYFGMFRVSSLLITVLPAALFIAPVLSAPLYLLLAAVFLYQFCIGLRASSDYSVVPDLFSRKYYGKLMSRCGIAGSAMGALVSVLNATLFKGAGINSGRILFFTAVVLYLTGAVCVRFLKPIPHEKQEKAARSVSLASHFTLRNLYLLLPHLLRGVTNAGFYYYVIVSFSRFELPAQLQPLMVTVGIAGSACGCFVFGRMDKRIKTGKQILIANAVTAACALATAANGSAVLFFLFYFLYMLSTNVANYAIPTGVMYLISKEELPFISSARMLAYSGASFALIPVWGSVLNGLPALWVMGICAAIHVAAGVIFNVQLKDPLR